MNTSSASAALTSEQIETLREAVINALRTVHDPEIPVNIYDLGLIYEVNVNPQAEVRIKMTLTTPTCPEAQTLPANVEAAARSIEQVVSVTVELVWDPPWTKERIPEDIRLLLGLL